MADTVAIGGLALVALAGVPSTMACFLPPHTEIGGADTDPERAAWLRRGEFIGGAVSLALAAAVSMIAATEIGEKAWLIFLAAFVLLGLYLWEYERAISMGAVDCGQ